jgi:hypothetical protein
VGVVVKVTATQYKPAPANQAGQVVVVVGVLVVDLLVYPDKVLLADQVTEIKVPPRLVVVGVEPENQAIPTFQNRLMAV